MKICEDCKTNEYDETKYLRCASCHAKYLAKQLDDKNVFKGIPELIEAVQSLEKKLGAVNNNIYALRFIEEHKLKKESRALIWNIKKADKKGDFEIIKKAFKKSEI